MNTHTHAGTLERPAKEIEMTTREIFSRLAALGVTPQEAADGVRRAIENAHPARHSYRYGGGGFPRCVRCGCKRKVRDGRWLYSSDGKTWTPDRMPCAPVAIASPDPAEAKS
jgi:hypothetical protein